MSGWFQVWLTLAAIVGAGWLVRLIVVGFVLRGRIVLTSDSHAGPLADAPRISVLVAARDEEKNIEACISTLLVQDYPNFEVIAVDDRSDDRTLEILRRFEQQAAGRLRVVSVEGRRAGWFGKNNAMHEGVKVATGDWLCFTDADCRQVSRRTLSVAMGECRACDVEFLSITPVLDTRTVWERITQPVCALVLILWFLPSRVNNPAKRTAYANGAFMLVRRDCYDAIGGHERLRDKMSEDIHMARIAKDMGRRLRVVENDDLYRTRMYRTVAESWRGWSRIFYGCLATAPRVATSASLVILFSVMPWLSLIAALVGWAMAGLDDTSSATVAPTAAASGAVTPATASAMPVSPWTLAVGLWGLVVGLKQLVMWRLYPVLKVGRCWSFTYVIGAVIVLGMLGSAFLKALGVTHTHWRGRTYGKNASE